MRPAVELWQSFLARVSAWKRMDLYMLLSAVGVFSAAFQLLRAGHAGMASYYESLNIARTLAAGGGFANPYTALATGPTAHMPPLFPLFLAGLIRLFGDNPTFALAACCSCVAMHVAYALLFLPLSELLFGSIRPGLAASLFTILLPSFPVMPQWEAIYAAAGSMLFCLLAGGCLRARFSDPVKAGIIGASAGLLLLLNATTLVLIAAWVVFSLFREKWPLRRSFRLATLSAAAAFVVLSPWVLRNYFVLGAPVVFRDNLGMELAVSNNDLAVSSQVGNKENGAFERFHPNYSLTEAAEVKTLGEVAYNRKKTSEAVGWIREHPSRFATLTLKRAVDFWFPAADRSIYGYTACLATILSMGGLVLMIRDRAPSAVFILSVLALTQFVFYFVHSSLRLRLPIMWLTLLMAGYLLARPTSSRLSASGRGGSSSDDCAAPSGPVPKPSSRAAESPIGR